MGSDDAFYDPEPMASRAGCPFQAAVSADLRRFRRLLGDHGLMDSMRALEARSARRAAAAVAFDWAVILTAWAACVLVTPWCLPLSALLVGNRQRALGNLLHDGGHWMLDPEPRRNERWVRWILAPSLFADPRRYRDVHREHHRHLGSPSLDPDYIHRDAYRRMSWPSILAQNVVHAPTWLQSTLGHLPHMSWRERGRVAAWWAALLGALGLASDWIPALAFAALWLGSRATVFHVITTFRELTDHAGLSPGNLLDFTRNGQPPGLLGWLFHPHNNGYHLMHHLNPRLPFHALPRAHELCLVIPWYAAAHHCDGYLTGQHAVVDCWRGRCGDHARAAAGGSAP